MTQYLIAIHHPDDFDPATQSQETSADVAALNDEMVAAGVRVFVGGLKPAGQARSIDVHRGKVRFRDGPYVEAKEHVGGLWVLECPNMEAAEEWGRKAAIACRTPVEVRAFYSAEEAAKF